MDDILIFTETTEELDKRTRKVLDILQENNLYLKPEKCKFEKQRTEYLGHIICYDDTGPVLSWCGSS
jgi:hypothetical protein